jgi:DNA-binding transcriptional MerR regulator
VLGTEGREGERHLSGGPEVKTAETRAPADLPIYPIRTVARLSGVDARRIRAWESQYGLLRPARTRGGHRLFSQQDIDRIRRIRQLIDEEGLRLQGVRLLLEAESAANGDR